MKKPKGSKKEIHKAIESLPPEALSELEKFLDYLKFKTGTMPPEAKIVKLGGLWQGIKFTESEIIQARREMWSGLGKGV